MAIYHGYDGDLTINSVDLSDHCVEFEIEETFGDLDATAMGDTHQDREPGLGDFTLTATFQQDQAASSVYATLQALVGTKTTFAGKATSGAASGTNRDVSGSIIITEFSHMHPQPGSLDTFSVTWPGAGGSGLTVATS